jgi:hypothetical protein
VPFVVGVTHLDEVDAPPEDVLEAVRERLGIDGDADVIPCDTRDREHVKDLLLNVLMGVLSRLEAVDAAVG